MKRQNEKTLDIVMLVLGALWWAGIIMLILSSGNSKAAGVVMTIGTLCFLTAYVGGPITAAILSRQRGVGNGCVLALLGLLVPGLTLPILVFWGRRRSGPDLSRLREKQDLAGLGKMLHYRREAYVRSNAANALAQVGGPQVESLLVAIMGEKDNLARAAAAEALGHLATRGAGASLSQQSVAALFTALQTPDVDVRVRAAWALGQVGGPEAESRLIGSLNDPDPCVRRAAVQALGKMGSAAAVAPLTRGLQDRIPRVRQRAAEALGRTCLRLNDVSLLTSTVPLLVQALQDGDAGVRKCAAEMLGLLRDSQALAPLVTLLNDPVAGVRSGAALGLGLLKDAQAVDPLLVALRSPFPGVRWSAAVALGQIGDRRSLAALTAAAQDGDAAVRQAVAGAMQSLQQ